jgi:FMN phosphatase YigB (HAD superfamily)
LKVKSIIFDADGILYVRKKKDIEFHVESLRQHGWQGSKKDVAKLWSALKKRMFRGVLQREQAIKILLSECGVDNRPSMVDQYKREYDQWKASNMALRRGVKQALTRFKRDGIRTIVLTDTAYSAGDKTVWLSNLGIHNLIDVILSSCDIGVTKEFEEAFVKALKTARSTSDQTIFVGHEPHEIKNARKLGIITIALNSNAKANYSVKNISNLIQLIEKLKRSNSKKVR